MVELEGAQKGIFIECGPEGLEGWHLEQPEAEGVEEAVEGGAEEVECAGGEEDCGEVYVEAEGEGEQQEGLGAHRGKKS